MEAPVTSDPEVLELIYRRFNYLKDHPLKLRGSFIDEAVSLGRLEGEDFLAFLMAYEVEDERPTPDHFPFLTAEENLQVTRYRLIRPAIPWPQPTIGVAWNFLEGVGRVTGTYEVDVVMKPVGEAQLWWGGSTGVIWEAFFERDIRAKKDHELLMRQLWETLERYLAGEGVTRVYTHDRDPALDDAWYRTFLAARGYTSARERSVTKELST